MTVTTVHDEVEANLKKTMLENFDIQCLIEPQAFSAYPSMSQYKINVPAEHAKRAWDILSGIEG